MEKLRFSMKKLPLLAVVFAAVLVLTGALSFASRATAAPAVTNVTVQLNPGYRIVVDGVQQNFFNSSGNSVYPLVYNGTTYLPLRAIGELMRKNVNWDEKTLTVSLDGTRTASPTTGPLVKAQQQYVTAQVRPDFTIMLDGVQRNFSNADGTYIYPLLYNGSVYLPLRAIGELMGKSVSWDGQTSTITLTGGTVGSLGSTVTDADSFSGTQANTTLPGVTQPNVSTGTQQGGQTQVGSTVAQPEVMSNDEARAAALRQVPGASMNNITKLKLEYDDGRWQYEVRIYYNFTEYEMELDAYTGALLEMETERDDYLYQQSHQNNHNSHHGQSQMVYATAYCQGCVNGTCPSYSSGHCPGYASGHCSDYCWR